jgi:ABC-type sugar transport system ATPase subunit
MVMALFVSGAYPEFAYWTISGEGIFINMLGGVSTFLGPMVGTVLLLLLNDTVTRFTEYHGIVLGVVILFFALGLRKGPAGFRCRLVSRTGVTQARGASDARDPQPRKILRRREGDQRRHARLPRRFAHGGDRPERRRQEHVLQPDHRRLEAGFRPGAARRRRSRRPLAAGDRAPRHRPRLPGRQHLQIADGAGDHAAAVSADQRSSAVLHKRFPLPETRDRAEHVMELLGLASKRNRTAATLSHGDQKLLDIALALVLEPKVLLLDEPTAGMGPEERWRMIDKVRELWETQKITVVFIEHDMDIVFKIAPKIVVLCYGRILATGTPDEIRNNSAVIEAYLGTEHAGAAA